MNDLIDKIAKSTKLVSMLHSLAVNLKPESYYLIAVKSATGRVYLKNQ